MEKKLYTAASIVDMLYKIEELKEHNIEANIHEDGSFTLAIDGSSYEFVEDETTVVDADTTNDMIEEITEAENDAVVNIEETEVFDTSDMIQDTEVESGIITEALKTLAIGGMVRLGAKWLKS